MPAKCVSTLSRRALTGSRRVFGPSDGTAPGSSVGKVWPQSCRRRWKGAKPTVTIVYHILCIRQTQDHAFKKICVQHSVSLTLTQYRAFMKTCHSPPNPRPTAPATPRYHLVFTGLPVKNALQVTLAACFRNNLGLGVLNLEIGLQVMQRSGAIEARSKRT